MNGCNELSGALMAGIVAVALVSLGGGFLIGYGEARTRRREQQEAEAAAKCPGCATIAEPAQRLAAAGARVSGVEWFGRRKINEEFDPVDDANQILRAAIRRVDALEKGDWQEPGPVAQKGQRPYNR